MPGVSALGGEGRMSRQAAIFRQVVLKGHGVQLQLVPTLFGLPNTVYIEVQLESDRLAFEIGLLKTDGVFAIDAHVAN